MAPPDANAAHNAAADAVDHGVDLPAWQSVVWSDAALIADFIVPANLRCLRGHFPGNPVVPGIAFVGWALELLRTQRDAIPPVRRLSRLRFRQPVLPGMAVTLTVRSAPASPPGAGSTLRFTLQQEGTLCASGQIDL